MNVKIISTRTLMLATINKILNTLTNYNHYNVSSKNRNIDIRITLNLLDGNFYVEEM